MRNYALQSPQTEGAQAAKLDVSASRVLLVDDNEQNLELLLAYLDELGCELRTALDGPEALDDVAKLPPDLILLDIMMPKMSGFQVCKKLKADAATAGIPILMVTAATSQLSRLNALAVGADDFLSKPFSASELLSKLSRLLELAAGRNVRQWA